MNKNVSHFTSKFFLNVNCAWEIKWSDVEYKV